MRHEILVESQPKLLELTDEEARALAAAGRRLASDKLWWRSAETHEERTVIRCTPQSGNCWLVQVVDAVGLIATGGLRLEIRPKIPIPHLLYLFGESGHFPRLDDWEVAAAQDRSLWELVARWYLIEAERLLRQDLLRDYQEETGWLPVVRGRVDATRTSLALVSGRLEALCEYDDFATDTPLNRTLREAARRVSASPALGWPDRRRALAIGARMAGIGRLRSTDLFAQPDRRARYYRPAVSLAWHVIAGQGRSVEAGAHEAWTFLIRTPEMVEAGIRNTLRRLLAPHVGVAKQGRQLVGSTMTLNPDLVFGDDVAIGDVKYKWLVEDWARADLYQVVAFAVAFGSRKAALIGFRPTESANSKRVVVGEIEVQELVWQASADLAPSDASSQLAHHVLRWLSD